MTWKKLKHAVESLNVSDDYEVDIVGFYSGSFGTVKNVKANAKDTPDGVYKEVQFFIDA